MEKIKITVLGSGTLIPSKRRGSPGFLFEIDNTYFYVDTGPGTLQKMTLSDIDYKKIDYILFSHIHPDHTSDLIPFLFATNYTPNYIRINTLTIIAPYGFNTFFDNLQKTYKWLTPKTYSINIIEVEESNLELPKFKIISKFVEHGSVPSVAYSFETKNSKIVYSGDTKYCEGIIEISKDADLLILESSFPSNKFNSGNHLNAEQAGIIASKSNAKNLLLFHFYPVCDEYDLKSICQDYYKGQIILSEDLMAVEVSNSNVKILL